MNKQTDGLNTLSEGQFNAVASLVSRANLANKIGFSYEGARDLYGALGYKQNLEYQDYKNQYERQDIAKAIIDRPIEEVWKDGFLVIEKSEKGNNTTDKTDFEKKWFELEKELKIINKFIRLDKLTSLGQFGILYLGLNDVPTKKELVKPVKMGNKNIKLNYIKPISEDNATIVEWELNENNVRYGLPTIYSIKIGIPGSTSTSSVLVHHTRIVHSAYDTLEVEYLGTPTLKAVFNRLQDLEKITGGSAEMFWRGARPGYQSKIEEGYSLEPTDLAAFKEQVDEYENNLRRIITSKGISLDSLTAPLEKPTEYVAVQLQMISASTKIPKRILTGSERGELASTQDRNAWLEFIKAYRVGRATPVIVNPFIDRCILLGLLPKVDYMIEWDDLFAPSEKERVKIGLDRARAFNEYLKQPLSIEILDPHKFIKFFLGFTNVESDMLLQDIDGNIVDELRLQEETINEEEIDNGDNK